MNKAIQMIKEICMACTHEAPYRHWSTDNGDIVKIYLKDELWLFGRSYGPVMQWDGLHDND